MTMHTRRWQVSEVAMAEELAGMLTGQDWTLCSGFRHGGHLWLNDATGPDGAQEYAVVREDDHAQVESITFGWLDAARGLAIICEIVAGEGGDYSASYGSIDPRMVDTPARHGRCPHCK